MFFVRIVKESNNRSALFRPIIISVNIFCFFFPAEDGIRDADVTGVQTCALPISMLTQYMFGETRVVVLFGVSGVGKTTIGRLLAVRLGWEFADADDYHPAANVAKMAAGRPLNDADRGPWLRALRLLVRHRLSSGGGLVLACSALKASYRDVIAGSDDRVRFVHLRGSFKLIRERLRAREGHFMPPGLLLSQFDLLDVPGGPAVFVELARDQLAGGESEEDPAEDAEMVDAATVNVVAVDVDARPGTIVDRVLGGLSS